jgi:hypothetical protein
VAVVAVDAVRSDGPPTDAPEAADRNSVVKALAALGARGELVLHDGACGEATLSLPTLERRESRIACAPDGARSPDGGLVARCEAGGIDVFSTATGELQRLSPGCAPSWRPDGELTAALGDEVVRFRGCPTCAETLISEAELERAARRHPTSPARAPLRVLVDGVAWLSRSRAAVLMSIRLVGGFGGMGPMAGIAFFEDGRLLETQTYFRVTGGRLAASPRGTYVTQTPDVILRRDGSQVSLPPHLGDARDLAFSPDERLLAIAGRHAITIVDVASLERYDATGGGLRSVTIPQPAARLAWR